MTSIDGDQRVFTLGSWRINPRTLRMTAVEADRGEPVSLTPQAMTVLQCLARAEDRTLSKEQLMATAWAGRVVTDDALTQVIANLRKALGDSSRDPAYIQTIPRVGYRLLHVPEFAREGVPARKFHQAWMAGGSLLLLVVTFVAWLFGDGDHIRLQGFRFDVVELVVEAPDGGVSDFDVNGRWLAGVSDVLAAPRLIVSDLNTGGIRMQAQMPAGVTDIRLSPSGNRLAVLATHDRCQLQLYDLEPFQRLASVPCTQSGNSAGDWLDERTLAWMDLKANGQWDMMRLALDSEPRPANLDLSSCVGARNLKAGPAGPGFVCEGERGVRLASVAPDGTLSFSRPLRDIADYEWLDERQVAITHSVPWKSGVSLFDVESGAIRYSESERLENFRTSVRGDILATRQGMDLNAWELSLDATAVVAPVDHSAAQLRDQALTARGLFALDNRGGDYRVWWSVEGLADIALTDFADELMALASDPAGRWLALTSRAPGDALALGLFELDTGQLNLSRRFPVDGLSSAFTPDGRLLMPSAGRWQMLNLDAMTLTEATDQPCRSLQMDGDGSGYCTLARSGTADLLRLSPDGAVDRLAAGVCPDHISLDRNGLWYSAAHPDRSQSLYRYRLLDRQTQQRIRLPGAVAGCQLRGLTSPEDGLPLRFIRNDSEGATVVRLTPVLQ